MMGHDECKCTHLPLKPPTTHLVIPIPIPIHSTKQNKLTSAPYVPRGQYSDAVLNELESQNNDQVEGIMGKVRQLKSVRSPPFSPLSHPTLTPSSPQMTIAIGDEIRESSALAEKMNDNFEGARVRIRGTMNRMLIMSQKTGVSWKVWILFFAAVFGEVNEGGRRGVLMYAERNLRGLPALSLPPKDENLKR